MALKLYQKEVHVCSTPPTQWLVNVNRKVKMFYLNNLMADDLKLEYGQKAMVAHDDKTGEWLITFGEGFSGYSIYRLSNKRYKPRYCFNGAKAAHALLNDTNANVAATFVVSRRPRIIDGQKWYRLLTKNPKRIN